MRLEMDPPEVRPFLSGREVHREAHGIEKGLDTRANVGLEESQRADQERARTDECDQMPPTCAGSPKDREHRDEYDAKCADIWLCEKNQSR